MSSPSQSILFSVIEQEAKAKFGSTPSLKSQQWIDRTFRERGGKFISLTEEYVDVEEYIETGRKIIGNNPKRMCLPLEKSSPDTHDSLFEKLEYMGVDALLSQAKKYNR